MLILLVYQNKNSLKLAKSVQQLHIEYRCVTVENR